MFYTINDKPTPQSFIAIPRELFTDKFSKLSSDAKLLYAFLLDRVSLSIKNNRVDVDGRVYITFKQSDAAELLGFGDQKVRKLFKDLSLFGLIERKKAGYHLPDLIFVKKLESQEVIHNSVDNLVDNMCVSNEELILEKQTSENHHSKPVNINGHRPVKITEHSYTNNQTNISQTKSIYPVSESHKDKEQDGLITKQEAVTIVKDQIDYNAVDGDSNVLNSIVSTMAEVYSSTSNFNINGQLVNALDLRERYKELNQMHIEYVLECIANRNGSAGPIRNLRSYIASCLYSAPDTMEMYYAEQRRSQRAKYGSQRVTQKFRPEGRDLDFLVV